MYIAWACFHNGTLNLESDVSHHHHHIRFIVLCPHLRVGRLFIFNMLLQVLLSMRITSLTEAHWKIIILN